MATTNKCPARRNARLLWSRLAGLAAVVGFLLILLPATVRAEYTWTTNDNTITIVHAFGVEGDLTIPRTINGLPVTSIGAQVFHGCDAKIIGANPHQPK